MPLLEEGLYYGKLVEIGTDCLGNQSKTPYVYVAWNVTHRALNGEWAPMENVRRESRWWVTEKAEPYTMDRLERLGFNGDFESPGFDAEPHPQRDGVQLTCKHDQRNGQVYEVWDLASGEKDRAPWDAEARRLFKAKYRTRLSSHRRPQGKPAAPPAAATQSPRQPDNSPVRDEEIPGAEVEDVPEGEIPY